MVSSNKSYSVLPTRVNPPERPITGWPGWVEGTPHEYFTLNIDKPNALIHKLLLRTPG
jgi:hypothetical protein